MASPPSELMVQVFGKIPLFKGFSPSQVRMLLGMCEHQVYKEGDVLCKVGEAAEHMFILVAGELVRVNEQGAALEEVQPVTSVCEVQLMTGQPYRATYEVSKQSHIFIIPRFQFERMLRRDVEVQIKAYRNLTDILVNQVEGGEEEDARVVALMEERQQYKARISSLERQMGQLSKKLEVTLDLLVQRGEMSSDEVEVYISDRLQEILPRVLIVDDEPEFRRFVREALPSFAVVEAGSGREALEVVHEERLDLIIADIRMPEMDGCALLTNLRSKFPGLPVLAVSGYMSLDDLQSYDFDGFIDKPIGVEKLQEVVEVTLTRTN